MIGTITNVQSVGSTLTVFVNYEGQEESFTFDVQGNPRDLVTKLQQRAVELENLRRTTTVLTRLVRATVDSSRPLADVIHDLLLIVNP